MHLSCQKQAEKYLKGTILAILFKKPTYLKNPWAFSFKKPILTAGFLNGFLPHTTLAHTLIEFNVTKL